VGSEGTLGVISELSLRVRAAPSKRIYEGVFFEDFSAGSETLRALVSNGGTITHHHAVGRDHAPWMEDEVGREGLGALRALKDELDPAGIMNPGKLMVDSPE